jgi:hypothetical protein
MPIDETHSAANAQQHIFTQGMIVEQIDMTHGTCNAVVGF